MLINNEENKRDKREATQTFNDIAGFPPKTKMELTREQILDKLRGNYSQLSSKYGMKKIGLFGSYAAESQDEKSDIDLVVEFEEPLGLEFIEFTKYLESLLGKKADVLTMTGIESIRNPTIQQNIKKSIIYV